MSTRRIIPAKRVECEIRVVNSRFIANAAPAFSVEEAKAFIAEIKSQYADATHNVPAFIIGHGQSIIAHCSDDGEPSGTAGKPALAVLQGSGMGDIVVVVTRYFGGTKLGTGGLVRAYTDSVKAVLENMPKAEKVPTYTTLLAIPYSYYEQVKILINQYSGIINDETFGVDVMLTIQFHVDHFERFQIGLTELTRGQIQAEIIEENPETVMPVI
jgi:uncharacterized YigZ family protein